MAHFMLSVLILGSIMGGYGRFPKDFMFGAATAAFQVEGAWLDDDKSLSVWDDLAHLPGLTADGMAPEIGADVYHRYMEDIELMKKAGIKHYRMSIAWTRIVPRAHKGSEINQKAVTHYRAMLQAYIDNGITPYVTLFHGDLPMILNIHGYGFMDQYLSEDFAYYAEACFKNFGDLVKYWFTFNEPWCIAALESCKEKEKGTKPYQLAHNVLLAHAEVVKLYREKYQKEQGGKIGIVLNSDMFYPKDPNNSHHIESADRAFAFFLGWFAEPIFKGDYPEIMKKYVGNRMPIFTEEQKNLIKNSADFFALNHYSSSLCEEGKTIIGNDYWSDINVTTSYKKEWKLTDMGWAIVPEGIHDILVEIEKRYTDKRVPILITENGMANYEPNFEYAKNDTLRIEYMIFLRILRELNEIYGTIFEKCRKSCE